MDPDVIFVFGMVGAIAGGAFGLTFGIMWWLGVRRIALSARMQSTGGRLHDIATRYVRAPKGGSYWSIVCSYDYTVDGKPYTGKRSALEFNSYQTEAKAIAAIGGRKGGDAVTVWYDPAAPASSALDRTPPRQMGLYKWGTIVAVVVGVVGVAFMLLYWPARP